MTVFRHLTLVTALFVVLVSCNSSKETAEGGDATPESATTKQSQKPAEPTIPDGQAFPQAGDFAASHILVSYTGATRANPNVTRTKEEAKDKADQLNARLLEDPQVFEELAKMESDGPSGPRGGNLGVFAKGAMIPAFETALNTLEVGKITQAPVETPFGYHIIRREGLEKKFWSAEAFVVAYKGQRSPPTVTRNQEEAKALADEVKAKLTHDNFDELAKAHNDFSPDGAMYLGTFTTETVLSPEMMDTLKKLDFGQSSGYLDMPFGYTFLRRVSVEQRAGSHILISYKGAQNAKPDISRTKEEAKAKAQELITELKDKTGSFAEYAQKNSDGPSGPGGGSLGVWFKGKMVPAFEKAINTLEVGEITPESVETPFGFHVILREAPPQ